MQADISCKIFLVCDWWQSGEVPMAISQRRSGFQLFFTIASDKSSVSPLTK